MKLNNNTNSSLKTPLSEILGTKGHIHVLRELNDHNGAMSHSELIRRTGLSRQGVYDVVTRLVETGILSYTGSGRQQLVNVRKEYPLFESIQVLFQSEKNRYYLFLETLKKLTESLNTLPKSVWIFGKVAQGTDVYGDPVQIALLGDTKTIDKLTDQFRAGLVEENVESQFDVTIEIRGVTIADLETRTELTGKNTILIYNVDPNAFLESSKPGSPTPKTHKEFDRKSISQAKAWTELLRTYPEIIPRTATFLEHQIPHITSGEKKELQEWKHLLENSSFQRLKKFLESDSERSTRLRQSLPFWQVLNEREREKFKELTHE